VKHLRFNLVNLPKYFLANASPKCDRMEGGGENAFITAKWAISNTKNSVVPLNTKTVGGNYLLIEER